LEKDDQKNNLTHYAGTKPWTIEVLQERGVPLNLSNNKGQTPSMWRAEGCNSEALKTFHKLGALNSFQKDNQNQDASHYAQQGLKKAEAAQDLAQIKKCKETLEFLEALKKQSLKSS
jgi:hypothetical protein